VEETPQREDTRGEEWRRRNADETTTPRRHSDRLFLAVGSLALIALLGAGGWWLLRQRTPAKKVETPVAVKAEEPAPAPAELTFQAPIQGRNIIALPAPLEGTLEGLAVAKGEAVFEEQLLARVKNVELESAREASRLDMESAREKVNNLDSALIAARLEASRTSAEADRARDEFYRLDKIAQRQRMLFNEGATPRLTYEKAEKEAEAARTQSESSAELARQSAGRVESAQHDLDRAKKSLDGKTAALEDTTVEMQAAEVRSPVDGVLVGIRVEEGGEVTPEMKDLFQIAVNPGELMVLVEPDPEQQKLIEAGAPGGGWPATVQLLELNASFDGKLARGEDGKYRVQFNAGDPNVKPGLNAMVRVKLR
jgi:multidrug efflux pump subunit AcrA (membrane-fusion protein)